MAGTSTSTYRNLIERSLRLLGIISEEESVEGSQAANALQVLNELIDELNASSELLYTTVTQNLQLTGADSYRIGPGGDFQGGTRPTEIVAAWVREGGTDYPLTLLTHSDFSSIPEKESQSDRPTYLNFDGGSPNSIVSVYPVGGATGKLYVQYLAPLSAVTYDTPMQLPPAYQKMIAYNLAVALAPEYGEITPPEVEQIARTTKMKVIGNNADVPYMAFTELRRFNINLGY